MTVQEAKNIYGVRTYTVSINETLTTVVRKLYDSEEAKYVNVLKSLNCRFDWFSVKAGSSISFFPKAVVDLIEEI